MTRPLGTDVGATAREMWETRPARRADDRKVAGVAGALARRYALDPTLVRVGFVVSAFYGVGLLLYLAGWLVLPGTNGDGSLRHRPHPLLLAAGIVLGLVALGPLLGGGPRTAIGVMVVAGLLYALHRSRAAKGTAGPGRTSGTAAPEVGAPGVGAPGAGAPGAGARPDGDRAGDGDTTRRPPDWDPLGAAPFAWDLPDPATSPPTPAATPRSRVTPVTLAQALLAAGLVGALGLLGVLPAGITPVAGTALAVVGTGLVVGAFLHRGRGLLAAAIPLVVVLAAASAASTMDFGPGGPGAGDGFGDGRWSPVTAAAVQPSYRVGFGDLDLDLRGLPPGQPPVSTTVQSGAGDVTVRVPVTADVTAECTTGAGEVSCLGRGGDAPRVVDTGPDGPGGPAVGLQVRSGAGDVEVRRG